MQSPLSVSTVEPGFNRARAASSAEGEKKIVFEPPGRGSWEADGTHFPRPLTHFAGERITAGFERGFAEGSERYGLFVAYFASRLVNRFVYMQPLPFDGSEGASIPPKPLFLLLSRLHPGARRRSKAAELAFERKLWREDATRWDAEVKPALKRAHGAIQAVDPSILGGDDLAKHLAVCADHLEEMHRQRHRISVAALLPVGDFVAHARAWTSAPFEDIVRCLKGSSPISVGVAAQELDALGAAIRGHAAARRALDAGGEAAAVLERLRGISGPVSERLAAYLDAVGHRSLGYDITDRSAIELTDVLEQAIRAATEGGDRREDAETWAAHAAKLRAAAPASVRPELDARLAEARHVYRLRDERGVYTDAVACGLARRAVMAAGKKLAKEGALSDPELAFDASCAELGAMLRGGRGPGEEELARRARWRTSKTVADIPPYLGPKPSGPPPLEWLPAPARRAAAALQAFLAGMYGEGRELTSTPAPAAPIEKRDPAKEARRGELRGLPVSAGVYEGTARVIADGGDFGRIKRGDILVARSTSPYFNAVLPLVGAIVTDRGGQLCHAAIVSREYGIPGVVGTREATAVIPDGARVRVDGGAGRVEILDERPS
jgi:pyruvate,water dikinase